MMKTVVVIARLLTAVGGINWGVIALDDRNLVEAAFGKNTDKTRAVYMTVGVAAIITLLTAFRKN